VQKTSDAKPRKMKRTGPSNSQLRDLITELRKKANEHGMKIWKLIADDLEKPTRQRRIVNLYKINKNTKANETIVVPGKVLGIGELDHAITVAAWQFSESASEKINKIGKTLQITELLKESPKGKRIRVIG
jgi:large subunit ribosomal protein L18e